MVNLETEKIGDIFTFVYSEPLDSKELSIVVIPEHVDFKIDYQVHDKLVDISINPNNSIWEVRGFVDAMTLYKFGFDAKGEIKDDEYEMSLTDQGKIDILKYGYLEEWDQDFYEIIIGLDESRIIRFLKTTFDPSKLLERGIKVPQINLNPIDGFRLLPQIRPIKTPNSSRSLLIKKI